MISKKWLNIAIREGLFLAFLIWLPWPTSVPATAMLLGFLVLIWGFLTWFQKIDQM